jgi:phosphopantetheine adenylyltransferase
MMTKKWENNKPTVQMLGRWQPWHDGHFALFERAVAKTGQVCIMVRDTGGTDEKNPFYYDVVRDRIIAELGKKGYMHGSDYVIMLMPNIVNITYGRDVGYVIEQEVFDAEIHSISATAVREQMKKDGLL